MVTCDPEVKVVDRKPDDDFVVLACDGIWDCLSSEECTAMVKEHMQQRASNEPFSRIIEEMFDKIMAKDIYQSSGIGTDNMTAIVVQFKKPSGQVQQ